MICTFLYVLALQPFRHPINHQPSLPYLLQQHLDSRSLSLSLSLMKLQHSQTGILISLVSPSKVDDRWKYMSCIIIQRRTCTMRSKSGMLWKKRPPSSCTMDILRDREDFQTGKKFPIVMNKTEVLLQRALESRVLVTKQSHSRYLNSQKEREMKRAANRTPKH